MEFLSDHDSEQRDSSQTETTTNSNESDSDSEEMLTSDEEGQAQAETAEQSTNNNAMRPAKRKQTPPVNDGSQPIEGTVNDANVEGGSSAFSPFQFHQFADYMQQRGLMIVEMKNVSPEVNTKAKADKQNNVN